MRRAFEDADIRVPDGHIRGFNELQAEETLVLKNRTFVCRERSGVAALDVPNDIIAYVRDMYAQNCTCPAKIGAGALERIKRVRDRRRFGSLGDAVDRLPLYPHRPIEGFGQMGNLDAIKRDGAKGGSPFSCKGIFGEYEGAERVRAISAPERLEMKKGRAHER